MTDMNSNHYRAVISLSDAEHNFNLELRGQITILLGNSGTGKTFTSESIQTILTDNTVTRNLKQKIYVFLEGNDVSVDILKNTEKDSIIILDDATEIILNNSELRFFIERDIDRTYLIIYRSTEHLLNLGCTPANIATMEYDIDSRTFTLGYKYDMGGMKECLPRN